MLIADGFWELKSFVDWLAIIGLFLSLFSIWLSWALARRDLTKRLAQAEETTISRLKRALLPPEIADAIRCVREARDACRSARWERALDKCEEAQERLTRLSQYTGLEEADGAALDRAVEINWSTTTRDSRAAQKAD
jgi:hypothetical protein